jgi:hypothetical protein
MIDLLPLKKALERISNKTTVNDPVSTYGNSEITILTTEDLDADPRIKLAIYDCFETFAASKRLLIKSTKPGWSGPKRFIKFVVGFTLVVKSNEFSTIGYNDVSQSIDVSQITTGINLKKRKIEEPEILEDGTVLYGPPTSVEPQQKENEEPKEKKKKKKNPWKKVWKQVKWICSKLWEILKFLTGILWEVLQVLWWFITNIQTFVFWGGILLMVVFGVLIYFDKVPKGEGATLIPHWVKELNPWKGNAYIMGKLDAVINDAAKKIKGEDDGHVHHTYEPQPTAIKTVFDDVTITKESKATPEIYDYKGPTTTVVDKKNEPPLTKGG